MALPRARSLALSAFFAVLAAVLLAPWPNRKRAGDAACPLGFGSGGGGGEEAGLPSFAHHFGSGKPGSVTGIPLQQHLTPQHKLLLYWNATVWTGEAGTYLAAAADASITGVQHPPAPTVQAFLVDPSTGRFVYVGSTQGAWDAAAAAVAAAAAPEVEAGHGDRLLGEGAAGAAALLAAAAAVQAAVETVDLQGAHVTPGLIDAHLHLIPGGLSLGRLDLSAVAHKQQFVAVVAAATAQLGGGGGSSSEDGEGTAGQRWLLGGGWDESHWGGEFPSAVWIDEVTPHTPVLLMRHDAHMALANSAALRLAGVRADTPDPPGGSILRGADGRPTGLLTDSAIHLVSAHMPPLSVEDRRRAFEAGVQHALSLGVTFVHDMGRIAFLDGEEAAWQDLEEVYVPAANEGRLPLRIYSFVPLTTWRRMAERVKHLGTSHPSGMLLWGGVKEFADGSLGSRTALFHVPYADAPGSSGTRTIELDSLRQMVAASDAAGLQVAVHAIGDRAVDEVLQIYAELAAANHSTHSSSNTGSDDGSARGGSSTSGSTAEQQQQQQGRQRHRRQHGRRRHRIEHVQHISGPDTARRLAAVGVVVTPNPQHLLADRGVLEARLGAERAGGGRTYAFRTLREAGVTAAFASDWPVVPLNPAGALFAAVHRRAPGSGEEPWAPEERMTWLQALASHTLEGAAAAGLDRELGSVQAGKLADFVVFSGPPGASDAAGAAAVPAVLHTFVGGHCQFGCSEASATA